MLCLFWLCLWVPVSCQEVFAGCKNNVAIDSPKNGPPWTCLPWRESFRSLDTKRNEEKEEDQHSRKWPETVLVWQVCEQVRNFTSVFGKKQEHSENQEKRGACLWLLSFGSFLESGACWKHAPKHFRVVVFGGGKAKPKMGHSFSERGFFKWAFKNVPTVWLLQTP